MTTLPAWICQRRMICANFEVFDFELTGTEMDEIAALDKNKRYYTSTPEMLKGYAAFVPPVEEQK